MTLKKLFSLLFGPSIFIIAVIFSTGCGSGQEKEVKSLEQIRAEEGIPVRVEAIQNKPFRKYLSYYSKLSGLKEATKGAAVGGKIEKIRFKVGDFVQKDQVIIEMAEDNPGLQYEQAKSALVNAEKTYQRMKKLLAAGETSQANFDGTETQYLVAKRNYEAQRQLLFIQSPFTGTIVDIKVNEGDNIKNDTHLFTVSQLGTLRAEVWANEEEIASIKKGMKSIIEYNGKIYNGVVTKVAMVSDPYKQAFSVEMEFGNDKHSLPVGVTSDVKILTYENKNAIVIPRNLVNTDNNGTFVFVEENGQAVKKYISNGNDSGLDYEVRSGLKLGEKLITQGTALLDNSKKVKVIQ